MTILILKLLPWKLFFGKILMISKTVLIMTSLSVISRVLHLIKNMSSGVSNHISSPRPEHKSLWPSHIPGADPPIYSASLEHITQQHFALSDHNIRKNVSIKSPPGSASKDWLHPILPLLRSQKLFDINYRCHTIFPHTLDVIYGWSHWLCVEPPIKWSDCPRRTFLPYQPTISPVLAATLTMQIVAAIHMTRLCTNMQDWLISLRASEGSLSVPLLIWGDERQNEWI